MITVKSVSNPRATNVENLIDVDLDTSEYGVIACSLHPEDKIVYHLPDGEATNGNLYHRARAGEFDQVATCNAGKI